MKLCKKWLSLCLALCMVLSFIVIPAHASSFNNNYTLSGTSADKMVAIAAAQVGRSKSTMGYSDAWCARFVSDVASKAGESAAIPYNAGCRQLYNAIINSGGKAVSTPQKGDIVFFVCTKCHVNGYNNAFSHVGIMVNSDGVCISGNYNGKVSQHSVNNYGYEPHFVSTGDVQVKYVRPNYKSAGSTPTISERPQNDVMFYTWLSEKGKDVSAENATSIAKLEKGNHYYFWFYLHEANTGKKVPDSYPAVQVSVKMTITDPNGKSQSFDYKNSSENWVGFTPTADGTYTFTAAVTGDYSGTRTIQSTISTEKPSLVFSPTSLTMNVGETKTTKVDQIVWGAAEQIKFSIANSAICTGSANNENKTLTVTGQEGGSTTITANMVDEAGTILASYSLPVTVNPDTKPPELTLSKTAMKLYVGDKDTVTANVINNGNAIWLDFSVADPTICQGSWIDDGTGNKVLSVVGLKEGRTTVTIKAVYGNKNETITKTFDVTVEDKTQPLLLSVSPSSVTMNVDDALKTLDISWTGTVPTGCSLCVSYNTSLLNNSSVKLIRTGTNSRQLVFNANKAGDGNIDVYIKNKSTGMILAQTSVPVTVRDANPIPNLNPADGLRLDINESRTLRASYTGTPDYAFEVQLETTSGNRWFPADITSTDEVFELTGRYCDYTFTGISAGSGIFTVNLVDSRGNIVSAARCPITVTDTAGLEDEINYNYYINDTVKTFRLLPPSSESSDADTPADTYSYTATATNTASGNIEDDIDAVNSSVSDKGTQSANVFFGYAATGSVNLPVNNSNAGQTNETGEANGTLAIPGASTDSAMASDGETALSTGGVAPESPTAFQTRFTDVTTGTFYYDAVVWADNAGILDSITGVSFNPSAPCPRREVVEFLWRASGCEEPSVTGSPFTDVSDSDSYYKAVLWALENGVTNGTGDGSTFSPNLTCSRAEDVTFLWRALGKPTPQIAAHRFTDVVEGAYYCEAVLWAIENGVTTGTGDGTTFSPRVTCSRSEIITFLYRSMLVSIEKS